MKNWLRRIRGAIGTGLTWAAGWSPIGAITGLVMGTVFGGPIGVAVGRYVVLFAVLGFIGGACFSTVLRLAEGRRKFDELTLTRFAALGAVGGLLLGGIAIAGGVLGPGLTFVDAIIAGATTLLGAGSAVGSLALARRADDQELLEPYEEGPEVKLTESATQQLLGSSGSSRSG